MLLSICIATYKRADFLGETMDALVAQLQEGVEIVVVDGASPDATPQVMRGFTAKRPQVRYFRESENSGVDRDFDKAVERAQGAYCWLMSDDDVVAPGAIGAVVARLASQPDLMIANAEIRDKALATVLKDRQMAVESDRTFTARQHDELLALAGSYLSFIGGVVVRRAWWLGRDRSPYFGSLFIHVGVIFQQPAPARVEVISQPLVRIRYGNAMWSARGFEIWMVKWPRLVWSFSHLSSNSRAQVTPPSPPASLKTLLWYRAVGAFDAAQLQMLRASGFAQDIHPLAGLAARFPRRVLNAAMAVYCRLQHNDESAMRSYDLARASCASALARILSPAVP